MSALLLTLSCVSVFGAQDVTTHAQDSHGKRADEAQHFASLEQLLGSKLELAPSAEDRLEAVEDGEVADRPKGKIDDLILDQSGRARWAAVSVGGFLGMGDRVVLVPIENVKHVRKSEELVCQLDMTKSELKLLEEFDADEAKQDPRLSGLTRGTVEAGARDAGQRMDAGYRGKEARCAPLMASDLMGLELHGSDGEFGSVSNALVNASNHQIAYVIVSHGETLGMGGTEYLFPMSALQCEVVDDESQLRIGRTLAQLETSVEYIKPEHGLVDRAALELVDKSFAREERATDKR